MLACGVFRSQALLEVFSCLWRKGFYRYESWHSHKIIYTFPRNTLNIFQLLGMYYYCWAVLLRRHTKPMKLHIHCITALLHAWLIEGELWQLTLQRNRTKTTWTSLENLLPKVSLQIVNQSVFTKHHFNVYTIKLTSSH